MSEQQPQQQQPQQVVLQPVSELRPFHSPGSAIHPAHDGRHVVCQRNTSEGSSLFVVDTADCSIQREFVGQTEKVTAVAVSPSDAAVYTANKELLLRKWDWQTGESGNTWRSFHKSLIGLLALSEDGRRLASASSDGIVRLWDRAGGVTRPCRGHSGVLSLLRLLRGRLFSCDCHDYNVRVWDAESGELRGSLAGHQSTVTGLCLIGRGQAVTCGRDQVLILWQLSSYTRLSTLPCDESLECCILAPAGLAESLGIAASTAPLLTGGQSGRIRFWDLEKRRCVMELSRGEGGARGGVEYTPGSVQCALPLGLEKLLIGRQAGSVELYAGDGRMEAEWCGSLGEVTCVQCGLLGSGEGEGEGEWGGQDTRLLVVTDSGPFTRLFLWKPGSPPDWRCRSLQLHGEADSLLCCQLLPGNRLLTGAKGGRVRLHQLQVEGSSLAGVSATHLGDLEPGHESHVTCLAATADGGLAVSACETPVLKVFRVTGSGLAVVAMVTRPHEKPVNCLAVSPNDALLAAGSRDKSLSLWSLPKLKPVGRLLGHRRGVWSARFCGQQQLLASVSVDGCARVWDLRDLSCQRCLQGDHALYDLAWLGAEHLLTADQAGLIRAWSLADRVPVETREGHTGRAWCLVEVSGPSSSAGRHWLSGGEDGRLMLWRDATAEAAAERAAARAEAVEQEQRLANLLASGRKAEALALALKLGQPGRSRGIVAELVAASGTAARLDPELVRGLEEPLQQRLLEFCASWNTNSRTCYEAQCALHALLLVRGPAELLSWPAMRKHLPGLVAFTERHERRAQQLAACQYLSQLLCALPTST